MIALISGLLVYIVVVGGLLIYRWGTEAPPKSGGVPGYRRTKPLEPPEPWLIPVPQRAGTEGDG